MTWFGVACIRYKGVGGGTVMRILILAGWKLLTGMLIMGQ